MKYTFPTLSDRTGVQHGGETSHIEWPRKKMFRGKVEFC